MQNTQAIQGLLTVIGKCKKALLENKIFIAEDKYDSVMRDWQAAIEEVVVQIYGVLPKYTEQFLDKLNETMENNASMEMVYALYDEWESICMADCRMLSDIGIELDCEFERLLLTLTRCTEERLVERLIRVYDELRKNLPTDAEIVKNCYSNWRHLWGEFEPDNGNWDHFRLAVEDAKSHIAEYRDTYASLMDYSSKRVLYGILKFRLELDFEYKDSLRENGFVQYFDLDICNQLTRDAVFVDCGAFNGDSALDFLKNYTAYKRIYLYEMIPSSVKAAEDNLKDYSDIVFRNAGVGSRLQAGESIKLNDFSGTSASILNNNMVYNPVLQEDRSFSGLVEVPFVALDEDISEPISFLKMDIEGSELNAIDGAREHIQRDKPILAICTYHHYEHLWKVMQEIKKIRPDYKFYMRFYGNLGSVAESEHILYAV